MRSSLIIFLTVLLIACTASSGKESLVIDSSSSGTVTFPEESDTILLQFPWIDSFNAGDMLINRINAPANYERIHQDEKSFGYWLRHLPLKPGNPDVLLYDGSKKYNQNAHTAVFNIDPGKKDLQQCADAVMRLRAEYLFYHKRHEDISFRFTSGDKCSWNEWKKGMRPVIKGNNVSWKQSAGSDASYSSFKNYLHTVFMYAGSASLEKELTKKEFSEILPGDVWIKGGHPGHAVLVMDVAMNSKGNKVFLLAQSYMPAQEIHLLKNPLSSALSPWFSIEDIDAELITPEWTFKREQLRSF